MRQSYPNPARGLRHSAQSFVLAALLFAPWALDGQSPPAPRPPTSPRSGGAGEMSAEEIFRRFASRILFLTCDISEDEGKLASGVLISEDGFVATNAHVVEGCRMITAIHINGASRQSAVAVLKYYDQTSDTAVLKLDGQSWDHFDTPSRSVRIGERVYAIGNPRGFEQSISEGIVSGERQADGASWIQHSAPISPGSSGGALISSRGELLGINSWTRKDSQNLNFAVPAATLSPALTAGRQRVVYLSFPPTREDLVSLSPARVRALTGEAGQGNADSAAVLINAAELGNVEAEVMLSGLYLLGLGVPKDYAQAAMWSRKAADQRDPRAEYSLGKLYAAGNGVPLDRAQAAVWYRKAAEQGYASAQFGLGVEYLDGQGVPKNYREAYFWVKIAAAGVVLAAKPEDIAAVLDRLIAPNLTAAEMAQEQKRVREWLAAHAATVK